MREYLVPAINGNYSLTLKISTLISIFIYKTKIH